MANKDMVDATPCPPFTPKPWPLMTRKMPISSLFQSQDSAIESDDLFPPVKKQSGAPKAQEAEGGKKLKREGAIANIMVLYKVTSANPNELKCLQGATWHDINDVMDIDNRY